jgi:hypothetical protein
MYGFRTSIKSFLLSGQSNIDTGKIDGTIKWKFKTEDQVDEEVDQIRQNCPNATFQAEVKYGSSGSPSGGGAFRVLKAKLYRSRI